MHTPYNNCNHVHALLLPQRRSNTKHHVYVMKSRSEQEDFGLDGLNHLEWNVQSPTRRPGLPVLSVALDISQSGRLQRDGLAVRERRVRLPRLRHTRLGTHHVSSRGRAVVPAFVTDLILQLLLLLSLAASFAIRIAGVTTFAQHVETGPGTQPVGKKERTHA